MNFKILLFNFDEKTDTLTFEVTFRFHHYSIKDQITDRICNLQATVKAIRRFHFGLKKDVVSIESYDSFPAPVRHQLGHLSLNALFQALNSHGLNYFSS